MERTHVLLVDKYFWIFEKNSSDDMGHVISYMCPQCRGYMSRSPCYSSLITERNTPSIENALFTLVTWRDKGRRDYLFVQRWAGEKA
jgi:hypothetical protein